MDAILARLRDLTLTASSASLTCPYDCSKSASKIVMACTTGLLHVWPKVTGVLCQISECPTCAVRSLKFNSYHTPAGVWMHGSDFPMAMMAGSAIPLTSSSSTQHIPSPGFAGETTSPGILGCDPAHPPRAPMDVIGSSRYAPPHAALIPFTAPNSLFTRHRGCRKPQGQPVMLLSPQLRPLGSTLKGSKLV